MIRKHSALAIRYTNTDGVEEALYYIAGCWRLGGFTSITDGEFTWVEESIKCIIDSALNKMGYSDKSVEAWTGLPIHIVKSKLRLREWTTDQAVHGVPF